MATGDSVSSRPKDAPAPHRLVPERPFPPYTFTGEGRGRPHPQRPGGHGHGVLDEKPPPLDPDRWRKSATFRFGIDLFNHGYYWESHEEWEALWHAAGRKGTVAEFLKGLIKLAAAGVKVRQARPDGVRRHGERAARHFDDTRAATGRRCFAGLDLEELAAFGRELARADHEWPAYPDDSVHVVFAKALRPR